MRRLPLALHRIIAGILFVPMMVALVDDLGNYRWFGPDDRVVFGLVVGVYGIWFASVAPSLMPRMEAYQRKKNYEARRKLEACLNDERHDPT